MLAGPQNSVLFIPVIIGIIIIITIARSPTIFMAFVWKYTQYRIAGD